MFYPNKKAEVCNFGFSFVYSRWESNPHSRKNWILNPARLPIPPLEHFYLGNCFKRSANLENIFNSPLKKEIKAFRVV